jgi:diguanylate cyclase (GGDEF)-like protein
LAVIYIDLDDFKAVNDTLGHDAGDAMLVEAARRLQAGLEGRGLVSRIGGDEFAILLQESAVRSEVERLVLEIQEYLARPVAHHEVELSCRASFGIALYPESDHRPSELMKNADLALYQAKRSGGNQHAFFDPRVREAVQTRISALSCARDALERDAIIPFYQPKVSFKTGRVTGFEALLRWMHPREGIQPPFLIKDAFEDPILSVELGRRMLARVIRDMQLWRDNGLEFGSVAVNVSAPEFVRGNFSSEVLNQLRSAHLPANFIEIEVTETVFLDDGSERVENALTELHRAGVSIALDDFGTGYASLTHLGKFPVSWLKIDRSFVSGLGVDPDATAIVNGVMGLSHSMGINVIAEGVETLEQWKLLKKKGCDVAQGYLISKPMSADLVPGFLNSWSGVDGTTSVNKRTARPRQK